MTIYMPAEQAAREVAANLLDIASYVLETWDEPPKSRKNAKS